LETERFGKRADLVYPPEDQTTTLGQDIVGGLQKGIAGEKTTGLGILAGWQGLIGDEEDQQYWLEKAREAELQQAQIVPGFQSSKQAYQQEGISGLTGHLLQNFGVSFPWMVEAAAGSYVGGKIGAAVGTPFGGPVGTAIGGGIGAILGATAVLTPKFFGTNILRQDQAHRAGERVDINEFYALMSAPVQAAADSVLYALLPRWLRSSTASKGITKKMLKGGAVGVPTEAATEVFQQFVERAQAGGLDYATSEEAMKEYAEAGFVGGVLGGTIGGALGPFNVETESKVKDKLNKTTSDIVDKDKDIPDEAAETLELEKEEKPPIVEVAPPVIPVKLSPDKINSLRQEGTEDGKRLFVGAMLTEKIKKITKKDGEEAAREYYDAYQKEFSVSRRTPAPRFEEVVKPKKKTGQRRFEIDKIKTDQFEGQEEGFAVRDNKWGGEDSLSYKTEEQAQAELKRREEKFGRLLTKKDTAIPPKPGEVLYTAKDKEVKEGTKKVGEEKTKGFEGFAWDSSKGEWVDIWEGKRF
jgi:hypothetical protein